MSRSESQDQIVDYLIERGYEHLNAPHGSVPLVADAEANVLVNDLTAHPHAFVLACLLDRQMSAEKVWQIPLKIRDALGTFEMVNLASLTADDWTHLLRAAGHRRPAVMADVMARGVERIQTVYQGNASLIWRDCPTSASLVRRFLHFHGAGPKIACMAANILVRDFKVEVADRRQIDISADVHGRRTMDRLGLAEPPVDELEIIYAARDLHPDYPGIFDLTLFQLGRTTCRPTAPDCSSCPLSSWCPTSHEIR